MIIEKHFTALNATAVVKNSKRDDRRFHTAFTDREEAQKQVIEYENKIKTEQL